MRSTEKGEWTPGSGRTPGMRRPVRTMTRPSICLRRIALGLPTSPAPSGLIVAAFSPYPHSRSAAAVSMTTWLRVARRRSSERSKSRRSIAKPMTSGSRSRTASLSSSSPVWSPCSTAMLAAMPEMIFGAPATLVAAPRQLTADLAHHIYAGVGHIEQLSAVAAITEVLDRGRKPDPVAIGDWSAVDKNPILRAHDRGAEIRPGGNPDLVATAREAAHVDDGVAMAVEAGDVAVRTRTSEPVRVDGSRLQVELHDRGADSLRNR